MPRGHPDYDTPDYQIAHVTLDPSLVLTAVKGVNSVDGKGRVWKVDNFNSGFGAWGGDFGGDGVSPALSTLQPEIDNTSVRLVPGTLASNGESSINQVLIVATPIHMGIEAGVYLDNNSPDYIISVDYRKTGASFYAQMKVSEADRKIYIRDSGGFVQVATLSAQTFTPGWLPVKLVIDFSDNTYERVVYGGNSVDVFNYSVVSFVADGIGSLLVKVTALSNAANNSDAFIGHTIFTLDEP